jgi:hypothetical protein
MNHDDEAFADPSGVSENNHDMTLRVDGHDIPILTSLDLNEEQPAFFNERTRVAVMNGRNARLVRKQRQSDAHRCEGG